jgi:glycosyltransferase involved in cell wall biosynthesis
MLTILGLKNIKAKLLEHEPKHMTEVFLVIDNQNRLSGFTGGGGTHAENIAVRRTTVRSMSESLSVLLVSHGFPPRETAGTERHTEALATELRERGHRVNIVAATRAPGRPQYEQIEERQVVRIVNNIATRALSDGESDRAIDQFMKEMEDRFQPDIVHVHHLQFLSSTMKFKAPTVATLHDQWGWCAAGGLGLQNGERLCPGPTPEACAHCHAQWRPAPSAVAQILTQSAGWLSPVVPPDMLHAWYKKIPARLRPSPIRGQAQEESPRAAAHRNRCLLAWFKSIEAIIAPSTHLAKLAEKQDLGPVEVIPHGLMKEWFTPRTEVPEDAPFVHLGTIAHHKGTDRVVRAWRKAFLNGGPPLQINGPILDPGAAIQHPVGPVLNPEEIRDALQTARALVIGSRWPENAPLIILEARAAGCPVIAPDVGGIAEIVKHGRDGLLFHDDDGLVQALQVAAQSQLPTPQPPPEFAATVTAIEEVYRRAMGSA